MRVSNGFSSNARGFKNSSSFFLFFFFFVFSATEGRRESENGGSGRGMEVQWKCGYLGVQKSLKKKKGGGERGKHRQSVRRNEMLFAVPVNIKYCAVTKEREDSQRGKRSRLRLVGLLLLFSFFPSPSSSPPPPSPFLFLFSFPFSSTFASHYVFVITMMTRGKKLSTLEIRNLSRS